MPPTALTATTRRAPRWCSAQMFAR